LHVARPTDFPGGARRGGSIARCAPQELAAAIIDCTDTGANVINLNLALGQPAVRAERDLEEAIDYAMTRGVIVVAAAGNQGTLGSSAITRHPWTIPVVACDLQGRPIPQSNLGHSIGRRGLSAPGDDITSLRAAGKLLKSGGTSVTTPFVTGAIALLWSEHPTAAAAKVRSIITWSQGPWRSTIVPALLDASSAYQLLAEDYS